MERREAQAESKDLMQPGRDIADNEGAIREDGTPVLDGQDLEENGISEEEADNIEWEEQQ